MKFINHLMDFTRSQLGMGLTHGGKRDTWQVFGYPDKVTIKEFRDKYKRGDIATRIVDAYPGACWSNIPSVIEDAKEQDITPWEKEVNDLFKSLDFWKHIRKLDKLVNLGKYAVLYMGFPDGKNLSEPVAKGLKPTYIRPLAEDVAMIESYQTDPANKRFGLPEMYNLTLKQNSKDSVQVLVHHSRVIHVAERTLDDDCEGQSILEHIWNKLIDLEKISGGSAEIFWLNARAGLSLEADVDADLGGDEEKEALKKEIDAYQHNLTRVIKTRGITIKPLNQDIKSPKDQFDICISIIAGATSIPKRILLGNEAGELASSQDENNWNNQIKDRRLNFCETHILNKFVNYMIELGILSKLENYSWEWPSLVSLSEKDKAEIGNKKSTSLVAYANSPEADMIIPPKQFVEEILGMEYREDEIAEMMKQEDREIDDSLEDEL
jgi:uncharacterized protein